MVQLPDVFCWIKVIDSSTGKIVADNGTIGPPGNGMVRYVVANDSDKPAGPLTIWGRLFKDNVALPNVLPAQQITLQPNQIWKKEVAVSSSGGYHNYRATLSGDLDKAVNEESEANNLAQTKFMIVISL